MLPFGMKRAYMRIFVVSGLFNVVAIVPFSYFFGATGASISILSNRAHCDSRHGIRGLARWNLAQE